ncbi:hypothetical protein Cgig2_014538 [Carnegiea gigantea]|uniref:Uncharacterized protein n=1 Tax=Carnegiea gigantea TaxID=171969 RepID=A0A9Q1K0V9_9CARY|nr:hypothetical protein Cgig2_014538 [Carnegiea gigantea]
MRFKGGKKISGHNGHSTEDIGWRFGIAIDGSRKQSTTKCSQIRRSAIVRENSSRASRDMAYEQMSTPAARLRAVEVKLEKDRTRTKQSKVNTNWLKAAKNNMIKVFGSWVIDTNVSFTVVDSIYTNPLLETIREVGPDVFLYKDRMDTFGTSIAQRAIASRRCLRQLEAWSVAVGSTGQWAEAGPGLGEGRGGRPGAVERGRPAAGGLERGCGVVGSGQIGRSRRLWSQPLGEGRKVEGRWGFENGSKNLIVNEGYGRRMKTHTMKSLEVLNELKPERNGQLVNGRREWAAGQWPAGVGSDAATSLGKATTQQGVMIRV